MTKEELVELNRVLDVLVRELYEHEFDGGPLCTITADGDVSDEDIVSCYRKVHENVHANPLVQLLCVEILHWLLLLTHAQRVIWWRKYEIEQAGVNLIDLMMQVHNGHVLAPEGLGSVQDIIVEYISVNDGVQEVIIWPGLVSFLEKQREACGTSTSSNPTLTTPST